MESYVWHVHGLEELIQVNLQSQCNLYHNAKGIFFLTKLEQKILKSV